jgi:hypothetical protein
LRTRVDVATCYDDGAAAMVGNQAVYRSSDISTMGGGNDSRELV